MMRAIKIIGLFALAVPVFVWSFLAEQRSAAYMAWLHSFAPAWEDARRVWRGLPTSFKR